MKNPLIQWFTKNLTIDVYHNGDFFVVRKSSSPNELICFLNQKTAEDFAEYLFCKYLDLEGSR